MSEARQRQYRAISKKETLVSWGVIATLAIIGIGVWFKQFYYDQTPYRLRASQSGLAAGTSPAGVSVESAAQTVGGEAATSDGASKSKLAEYASPSLKPMGAPESFNGETLSDKINGKAELYLENGFVRLECQRFSLGDSTDAWLEVFSFDMGNGLNAFAVFSNQRRAGKELEIGQFAYATENSLFMVQGKYYVEIVAAQASEELGKAQADYATVFAEKNKPENAEISALAFLPSEGMNRESIKLYLTNAFSFDRLDNVVTAAYNVDGTTVTAFTSARRSPEEAKELADAYGKLLLSDLGGEAMQTSSTVPGLVMTNVLGDHELVFATGNVLAGIHAASKREPAEKLATRLFDWITEKQK